MIVFEATILMQRMEGECQDGLEACPAGVSIVCHKVSSCAHGRHTAAAKAIGSSASTKLPISLTDDISFSASLIPFDSQPGAQGSIACQQRGCMSLLLAIGGSKPGNAHFVFRGVITTSGKPQPSPLLMSVRSFQDLLPCLAFYEQRPNVLNSELTSQSSYILHCTTLDQAFSERASVHFCRDCSALCSGYFTRG